MLRHGPFESVGEAATVARQEAINREDGPHADLARYEIREVDGPFTFSFTAAECRPPADRPLPATAVPCPSCGAAKYDWCRRHGELMIGLLLTCPARFAAADVINRARLRC